MAHLVHLRPADARRVPWRNGRGVTSELAVWPAGASFERGDFDVRISAASVPEAGPFSAFPGFDRVIVVTHGEGLVLSHGAAAPAVRVGALEPYRFSGDWDTSADLVGGPVEDFNVTVRRGRPGTGRIVDVDVDVKRPGSAEIRGSAGGGRAFLHVAAGRVTATPGAAGPSFDLSIGESLRIDELGPDEVVHVSDAAGGTSAVIVVRARLPG